MATKKKRINKTWVVLSIALSVALLAAIGAKTYLERQMAAIEARAKMQGETTKRVVARHELPSGARLTTSTVAMRDIPLEYAHSGSIDPAEFDRIDGRILTHSVKSGEMILWSMIEGKKAPTFSARINSGRRAMTFPVDEINSISGMLEPGDRIDLVITVDQGGQKSTFPFMQNMQVMATGKRVVDDIGTGEQRSYATVTLDTTPQEAQTIIVARNTGKIIALLRNPQDEQSMPGVRDLASLFNSGNLFVPFRTIPVLYGKSRLPADGLNLRSLGLDETEIPSFDETQPNTHYAVSPAPETGDRPVDRHYAASPAPERSPGTPAGGAGEVALPVVKTTATARDTP